jgi:hypothetical protein
MRLVVSITAYYAEISKPEKSRPGRGRVALQGKGYQQ